MRTTKKKLKLMKKLTIILAVVSLTGMVGCSSNRGIVKGFEVDQFSIIDSTAVYEDAVTGEMHKFYDTLIVETRWVNNGKGQAVISRRILDKKQ